MGYGLTAETRSKINSKYTPEAEQQAVVWVESVLQEDVFNGQSGSKNVQIRLKDGRVLCRLINTVNSASPVRFNDKEKLMPFKMMENIGIFLTACEGYGCSKTDLFQTADLYDNQNMNQVINSIHALGRKAQSKGFDGPVLGPNESKKNVREFTEEQMNAGQGIIGLQMGSNKGATASGLNYGKTRDILR